MFKIFRITFIISTLAFLIECQIPICTLTRSNFNDHSSYFKNIVEENKDFVNVKLKDMSILGSHDSLSSNINYCSKPNVNEPNNMVNNKVAMVFSKGLAVRFAKAQLDDIYNQLKAGVRYIDARITCIDGVYYSSHGFVSDKLENELNKILKFLDENPKEIIIFDILSYYPGKSNFKGLEDFIRSIKYKGKSLIDYDISINEKKGLVDLTYKDIVKDHAGVVIYSKENMEEETIFHNHLTNSNVYRDGPTDIDNGDFIKSMMKMCENAKKEKLKEKGLVIFQGQLRTSFEKSFSVYLTWSLLNHAYYRNYDVIKSNKIDEVLDEMPIYLCDYSTSNSNKFNDLIIDKMHKRNIKLHA